MSVKPRQISNNFRLRIGVVFVGFALFALLLTLRLVQLQVLPNELLEELGRKQFERVGTKASYRLPIYDRNGEELAVSVPSFSIYARPAQVSNHWNTAYLLSVSLGGNSKQWFRKLKSKRPFVWIRRQVDEEVALKLQKRKLPGIFFEPENKRVYPNGSLAANILGFTDIDGKGLAGVELSLNDELASRESRFRAVRDGRGKTSYISLARNHFGKGAGVSLTLDKRLQFLLEEELERSMEDLEAKAIIGVILHPKTGEILAMAQRPSFDPNLRGSSPSSHYANRAISHRFEPGSVLKPIFAASAIQSGLLRGDSLVDCEEGKIKVGRTWIGEADAGHHFSILPLWRVLEVSSNVGSVKVAQTLGSARVRTTLSQFGLTEKTGIRLPGEVSAGPRPRSHWTDLLTATVGFGQGVATTPIQLVASYLPFANGGYWIPPRIVKFSEQQERDLPLRRLLSDAAVAEIRRALIAVTEGENGTGKAARVPGVTVAGKTGTAQKYVAGEGYGAGKYFSSFIGFLPAQEPELLIGVMVDEPKDKFYASTVAAPLFRRIAERAVQHRSLPLHPQPQTKPVARVPAPLKLKRVGAGRWEMPELKGISLRRTLSLLGPHVERVRVYGQGYLVNQSPRAGAVLHARSRVALSFRPEPPSKPSIDKPVPRG